MSIDVLVTGAGGFIGQVLVRLGAVSEEQLLAALQEQTALPLADLTQLERERVDAALRRLGLATPQLQLQHQRLPRRRRPKAGSPRLPRLRKPPSST